MDWEEIARKLKGMSDKDLLEVLVELIREEKGVNTIVATRLAKEKLAKIRAALKKHGSDDDGNAGTEFAYKKPDSDDGSGSGTASGAALTYSFEFDADTLTINEAERLFLIAEKLREANEKRESRKRSLGSMLPDAGRGTDIGGTQLGA